jgi:hypothetical protein
MAGLRTSHYQAVNILTLHMKAEAGDFGKENSVDSRRFFLAAAFGYCCERVLRTY